MTGIIGKSWLAVAAGGLWLAPLAAQISEPDRAAIAGRVAAFDLVLKSGQVEETIDFIPPRLLRAIAAGSGVSEAEVRTALGVVAREAFATVKLVSAEMDVSMARTAATPRGERDYMLIPTRTVLALPNGRKLESRTISLAIKDDGQWYLVRAEDHAQIEQLRAVYPEFAGVDFPKGSTSFVD